MFMNNRPPNLSFTIKHSGDGKWVPFSDTLVTVESSGKLTKSETELHIKPTNTGIILHSTSAHPKETKYNIIRNMFHRAYNNSSNKESEAKSVHKIWGLMSENGFTSRLLKRLLGEVQLSRDKRGRDNRRQQGGKERQGYIRYIGGPHRDVLRACLAANDANN